jgi:CBS domain containing-hemolysin-like protein
VDTAAAVDVTQRSQVRQLITVTQEEGQLSTLQKDMMKRLANIPDVSAGSILIPIHTVEMVEVSGSRQDLLGVLARCPHQRILVYEKDKNNIIGYVDLESVLADGLDLKRSIKSLFRLNASVSVLEAISLLRKENHPIAAVVADSSSANPPGKKVLGILTLKDLVEELTGELTRHKD